MTNKKNPIPIAELKFDQIEVGDEAVLSHKIIQEDVITFAKLTGDFNPLHLDEDFASKTPFGKPIVYGMLTGSFISALVGMVLPGRDALLTSQTLEFSHPAYVGDTLHSSARVRRKSVVNRLILMDIVIKNQDGIKLIVGKTGVKVLDAEHLEPRNE